MGNPINGVQQAGTDRAQRIQQMLEQRHLQLEMVAAAHLKSDRRRAEQVADPAESHEAKPGDRDADGGAPGGGGGHRPPPGGGDDPPEGLWGSGHIVDVSA